MSIAYYAGARVKNGLNFAWQRFNGYCSQLGQDRWVIEKMFHGMRNGYFVDIGAYDGWIASNTYVLEKTYGWTGLCIEPNDELFQKLQKNRRCTLVQACLSDTEKDVSFLENGGAFGGMIETYPQDYRDTLLKYRFPSQILEADGEYRTVTKRAVPLATVLRAQHAPAMIDYLSIDTEGAEYTILKDFPFAEYTFLTITVEHNSVLIAKENLRSLLEGNGYILAKEGKHDDFYYHPRIKERF